MRCLLFGVVILVWATSASDADEIPGFFLKIAKNVPRIGRRSDAFFMKNFKNIPRIGRSIDGNTPNRANNLLEWLEDDHVQLEKRRLFNSEANSVITESKYSLVQPVNSNTLYELLEKDAIPTGNVKFVHWKDFDVALQLDTELYSKIVSLARATDQQLKQDLNLHFGSISQWYDGNKANSNDEFMPYSNGQDMYTNSKYDPEFLHYNHL